MSRHQSAHALSNLLANTNRDAKSHDLRHKPVEQNKASILGEVTAVTPFPNPGYPPDHKTRREKFTVVD